MAGGVCGIVGKEVYVVVVFAVVLVVDYAVQAMRKKEKEQYGGSGKRIVKRKMREGADLICT